MNVRNSMYRMVFSLVLLPFLLFSLLITQLYSSRLEKVITESLHVVANAQVAEMNNFCDQQKDYLALIGTMDISRAAMRGQLPEDTSQYLNNMLYSQVQTMSYMTTIVILDESLQIVAGSEEHDRYANEGIRPLIASMQGRPFYISNVLTDAEDARMLVAIARIESEGEGLGYILAEINLDFYTEVRERAELWDESTFYLLDGNQQIISAGTQSETRESFVTTEGEREDYNQKLRSIDFEANPQGSFLYKLGGEDYITYYSNVENTDWRVQLSVNLSNYQAQKTVYISLGFFLVILCALLAVVIGWFASMRIVYPIKGISSTLRAIQENQDYSLRVNIERQDELGSLAEEVNELVNFIETEDLYKTQQQRLLQEKAEQDALTKVLNKERVNQALQEALDRHSADGTALAVLFVDVDDFKDFNTNYGHSVGDQVLLFLTSILARQSEGTVGRVGGDEFLVIVESPQQVQSLDACLKQMEETVNQQFVVRGSGTRLPISCCIGAIRVDFAEIGPQKLTPEHLIDLADTAMYQAKNNGKHGYVIMDYK